MTAFEALTSSGGAMFETFDGGAEALAQTMSGKFSTVWGKFRQMMVDSMKPFENMFKSILDKAINFLDGSFKDNFINAFSTIANFINDLFNGDSSNFSIIENLINSFNTLKDAIMPIFDTLNEQFNLIFGSADENFGGIGGIIEGVANVISNVIKGLTPILELLAPIFNFIKDVAIAVWPVIEGIITVCSQVIKDVVEALKPAFDAVSSIINIVGETVAEIWPKIQETILNVWEKLQPVLDLFKSLCQLIADVFAIAWPPIAGIVETLWGIIGPIFEGIANILGKIAELCTKVVDGIGGVVNKVKDSKWNPFNWFGGNDEKTESDGGFAYGLNRVPRDGFKAVLHEGERVLTAREARQMDKKETNASNMITNNFSISGVNDPEEVVRLIVEKLKSTQENVVLV